MLICKISKFKLLLVIVYILMSQGLCYAKLKVIPKTISFAIDYNQVFNERYNKSKTDIITQLNVIVNNLSIQKVNKVRAEISNSAGLKLVDESSNHKYPMPLSTCDSDMVEVGRIREDLVLPNGIALFCSGDQIRKGEVTNVVEIIEELCR